MIGRALVTAAAVVGTVGGGAFALAGPLNKAWVTPDAAWVVHIDIDAVRGSSVCALLSKYSGGADMQEYEAFKTKMGFDPLKDLKGITVYGGSFKERDGVAVITATAAMDAVIERMVEKEHILHKEADGALTLYTWTEHGTTRYGFIRPGATPDERIALASPQKERLLAAIRQVETPEPARPDGPLARTPRMGSMIFGSVASLASIKDPEVSMIFKKTERLVADFGESGGDVYGEVTITTPSSEDATRMLHMAQGVVAMGQFAAGANNDLKGLAKVGEWIKLSADDKSVNATIKCSVAQLKELIEAEQKPEATKDAPAPEIPAADSKPGQPAPKEKPAPPR